MRGSPWMLGLLALPAAAAGTFASGCSSSSNPASSDASIGTDATITGNDASSGDGGVCFVDASLAAFAASDASGSECAACFQSMCSSAVDTCAHDCKCIALFSCLSDAGALDINSILNSGFGCVPGSITDLLDNPGLKGLTTCGLGPCQTQCAALLATGDGGATDASGAAAEASDADAGAPEADAADGG